MTSQLARVKKASQALRSIYEPTLEKFGETWGSQKEHPAKRRVTWAIALITKDLKSLHALAVAIDKFDWLEPAETRAILEDRI